MSNKDLFVERRPQGYLAVRRANAERASAVESTQAKAIADQVLFAGAVAGLAFALYLTYIEARVLGVWCIMCLSSLAIISGMTMVSGALWFKSRTRNL